MAHAAKHLAAGGLDRGGSVGLERMAKSIVDGNEEPGVASFRHRRLRKTRGQRVAVVDPGCLVRCAVLAGERRAPHRARDRNSVALGGELFNRERHRRIVESDRHVDVFVFEPAPRDGDADIGLVLVIRKHDFDRLAQHRAACVFRRHPRRGDRARATEIGIETGLVVEHADPDDIVGDLRACARQVEEHGNSRNQRELQSHGAPPNIFFGP